MKSIYFDNAATTQIDEQVFAAMKPWLTTHFGNASSTYSYGREARIAIEQARKSVAGILHADPSEIIFTSCGTESNNMAILNAIRDLGCRHIITSPIEHHAVLHTVEHYAKPKKVTHSFVQLDEYGQVDIDNLQQQLATHRKPCLVTLMHANNEIGNLLNIEKVARICKHYKAFFHSDCVQTVGHYDINLQNIPVDFISASAHKFHGPKGTGILFIRKGLEVKPLIFGGGHERNRRAGTENVAGIVGFAKALELATAGHDVDRNYILLLKKYLMDQLLLAFPDIKFNGVTGTNSLYTVLNVSFPKNAATEMLLFRLDENNICASGGSACSGGASSHVIKTLGTDNRVAIRFSFSRYNMMEEIDKLMVFLKQELQTVKKEMQVG